jgi:hypothetical protein
MCSARAIQRSCASLGSSGRGRSTGRLMYVHFITLCSSYSILSSIQPLSPALLAHLARFPKLTDVHILFPRPETQVCGAPNPTIDHIALADVASIFRCNPRISRVGIGNSVVWERHPGGLQFENRTASRLDTATPAILLVSDGSAAPPRGGTALLPCGVLGEAAAGGGVREGLR